MGEPRQAAAVRVVNGIRRRAESVLFRDSKRYWERRYQLAGDSGPGSYGALAEYKAKVLNRFVDEHTVTRVLEFGCGDGHQLSLARYPEYVGLDVAPSAIDRCLELFGADRTKSFFLYSSRHFSDHAGIFRADLVLSLDVLFHLIEDDIFEAYLRHLFAAAERYVIIYSSNDSRPDAARHVRHREFTGLVEQRFPEWELLEVMANEVPDAVASFHVYGRAGSAQP
jgi:SAM-dependent methyltransferase